MGLLLIPAGGALAAQSPERLAEVGLTVTVAMAAGLAGSVLARVRAPRCLTAPGQLPGHYLVTTAAGLVLLAIAITGANRLAPGHAGWTLLGTGLIAIGLREPRMFAEAHLLWAVALASLVGLGWAAAGGGGQLPGALFAWAVLGQLGQGFIWMAAERESPRLLVWTGSTLGRALDLASPFALLGLIGSLGQGATFLAGLAVASLLGSVGHVWPMAGRTASVAGATLSRLAVTLAILLDRASWPP